MNIHHGSILDVEADAIVSPANSFLRNDGGLAKVIHEVASGWGKIAFDSRPAKAYRECLAQKPLLAVGSCTPTYPGLLSAKGFKYIIHAVGPVWGGGHYFERSLLFSAYRRALIEAYSLDCNSVVLPAISAGIFGVPIKIVAAEACLAIAHHQHVYGDVLDVILALTDDEHVTAFERERQLNAL